MEEALIRAVIAKRQRLGLSIRALSAHVGISFSSLARIERGEGRPDVNSKVRLLEWLGPDAQGLDERIDRVALVHFRAMKNIQSGTVEALLRSADCLRREFGATPDGGQSTPVGETEPHPELSKDQMDAMAGRFRRDLGVGETDPLDPLEVEVEGVRVVRLIESGCVDQRTMRKLRDQACSEWSAMSVPLDGAMENWAVLLNDCHARERQRVTLLEEYWHILLGHKPTKIARVAGAYGRTYDSAEENDAYYLASATLLPREAVQMAVADGVDAVALARRFGTSPELVSYRIKRLGLWREHTGKRIAISRS